MGTRIRPRRSIDQGGGLGCLTRPKSLVFFVWVKGEKPGFRRAPSDLIFVGTLGGRLA
jgi:hypothetical protein